MPHQSVVVYTTAGPLQAHLIKGMLEAAGIRVQLSQEGAGAVYGLTVGPLGLVDILVAEEDAPEAEALLAAMERGELEDPDDENSVEE
jgi:hypothetical protein